MKVIKKDKDKYKIVVENVEDIYYLEKMVEKGDKIGMVDARTTSRGERGEKKKAYIIIEVENVKLDTENKEIKFLGEVVEAPEDVLRGYHSFNIKEDMSFDLYKKEENEVFKDLIKKAQKTKTFKILGVVIDNKESTFGEFTPTHYKELFEIKNKNKKGIESNEAFYTEVSKAIKDLKEKYDAVIIAGPGFAKLEVAEKLKNEGKVIVGDTSVTGTTGLKEIIKRGLLSKAIKEIVVEDEIRTIEEFFSKLGKESKDISYGIKDIMSLSQMGAVEKVIVCFEILGKEEVNTIIEETRKNRGEVIIIDKINPYYDQIKSFGGVIAFLRYSL